MKNLTRLFVLLVAAVSCQLEASDLVIEALGLIADGHVGFQRRELSHQRRLRVANQGSAKSASSASGCKQVSWRAVWFTAPNSERLRVE